MACYLFYPNRLFPCFAEIMPRLSELVIKKSKSGRVKKSSGEGKKRKTPPAEVDISPPEPAAPEIPQKEWVIFKEPIPQALGLPPPVEGKGKKVMEDPSRPPKKPKRTEDQPSIVPTAANSEAAKSRTLRTQLQMELHPNVGDSGSAMSIDYTKFLVEGMISIAPEVWDRFKSDQTGSLLNFGLMSSLIVSISVFVYFILYIFFITC